MLVVWFSRHQPTKRQMAELRRLFGDEVRVETDPLPFSSAEEVAARFRAKRADDLVVVAPMTVLDALCKQGLRPLWAQMEECAPSHPECEVSARERSYRFVEFRRVVRLELITEAVEPRR